MQIGSEILVYVQVLLKKNREVFQILGALDGKILKSMNIGLRLAEAFVDKRQFRMPQKSTLKIKPVCSSDEKICLKVR